jgi:hypothetical protein
MASLSRATLDGLSVDSWGLKLLWPASKPYCLQSLATAALAAIPSSANVAGDHAAQRYNHRETPVGMFNAFLNRAPQPESLAA